MTYKLPVIYTGTQGKVDMIRLDPAACIYCQASNQNRPVGSTWWVDTGLDFDMEGHLYLCNECFASLAGAVGWPTPLALKELENTRAENVWLKEKIRLFETFLNDLKFADEFTWVKPIIAEPEPVRSEDVDLGKLFPELGSSLPESADVSVDVDAGVFEDSEFAVDADEPGIDEAKPRDDFEDLKLNFS